MVVLGNLLQPYCNPMNYTALPTRRNPMLTSFQWSMVPDKRIAWQVPVRRAAGVCSRRRAAQMHLTRRAGWRSAGNSDPAFYS